MAEDINKPRPVQVTSPNYSLDRTNDIRIQKDAAQRLIARYLRDSKMLPGEANALANSIIDGLVSNMSAPARPALRGWRMIGQYPPEDAVHRVAAAVKAVRLHTTDDRAMALDTWAAVYRNGTAMPDDIVA
jgi:hypothetical protein